MERFTFLFSPSMRFRMFALLAVPAACAAFWAMYSVTYDAVVLDKSTDLFGTSAFLGVFFLHIVLAPGGRYRAFYTAAGVVAELTRAGVFSLYMEPGATLTRGLWMAAAATSWGISTYLAWRGRDDRRMGLVVWTMLFGVACYFSLFLTYHLSRTQQTFDAELYRIDLALGFNAIEYLGRWMRGNWWRGWALWRVYMGLPFVLLAVYGMLRVWKPDESGAYLRILGLSCFATLLYLLVPAIGPAATFLDAFPFGLPGADEAWPVNRNGSYMVCNAMPSMHITWALLAMYFTGGLALWVRGLACAFLGLTVMATLGSGQHYVIDLVVGYPLATALYAAGASFLTLPRGKRHEIALTLFLFVLSWLVGIRYGAAVLAAEPLAVYGCILYTLGITAWLKYRLDKRLI